MKEKKMRKFKTGDVVSLITGGPKMVVTRYPSGFIGFDMSPPPENHTTVNCQWWDENIQDFKEKDFHQDVLIIVEA